MAATKLDWVNKMKVSLIDHTGKGLDEMYAADLLIFTKNTRLKMSADGFDSVRSIPYEDKLKELEYMSNTIPSSWEFVDYTFMIEDCDRGFTHQLVRSRQNSYAQQTMRVLDVSGFGYNVGPTVAENAVCRSIYHDTMDVINDAYKLMIESGAAIEDARGVLPTNIHTNIVVKMNLRSAAELISKRSSPRTQGAYREFIEALREEILRVHPWAELFLRNRKINAAEKLDRFISEVHSIGEIDEESKTNLIKMVDILRS